MEKWWDITEKVIQEKVSKIHKLSFYITEYREDQIYAIIRYNYRSALGVEGLYRKYLQILSETTDGDIHKFVDTAIAMVPYPKDSSIPVELGYDRSTGRLVFLPVQNGIKFRGVLTYDVRKDIEEDGTFMERNTFIGWEDKFDVYFPGEDYEWTKYDGNDRLWTDMISPFPGDI